MRLVKKIQEDCNFSLENFFFNVMVVITNREVQKSACNVCHFVKMIVAHFLTLEESDHVIEWGESIFSNQST